MIEDKNPAGVDVLLELWEAGFIEFISSARAAHDCHVIPPVVNGSKCCQRFCPYINAVHVHSSH